METNQRKEVKKIKKFDWCMVSEASKLEVEKTLKKKSRKPSTKKLKGLLIWLDCKCTIS